MPEDGHIHGLAEECLKRGGQRVILQELLGDQAIRHELVDPPDVEVMDEADPVALEFQDTLVLHAGVAIGLQGGTSTASTGTMRSSASRQSVE